MIEITGLGGHFRIERTLGRAIDEAVAEVHRLTEQRQRPATPLDVRELRERNAQLETALPLAIVIEQAKGVLAERYRLDVERAFDVLRGAARSNRVKIHELAAAVVSSPRTPTAIELELVASSTSSSASRR